MHAGAYTRSGRWILHSSADLSSYSSGFSGLQPETRPTRLQIDLVLPFRKSWRGGNGRMGADQPDTGKA